MSKEKVAKEKSDPRCGPAGTPGSEAMKKMMEQRMKGQAGWAQKMKADCGCGCEPLGQNRE